MKKITPLFIFLLTVNCILLNAGEILKVTGAVIVGTVTGLGTVYYHKKANYFKELAGRNLETMRTDLENEYADIPREDSKPEDDIYHENNNDENNHLNELQNIYQRLKSVLKTAEQYDSPLFFINIFPEGDAILIHVNVEDTHAAIQKQLEQPLPDHASFHAYMNKASKNMYAWGNFTLAPLFYLAFKTIYYFQHKN